MAFLAYQRAVKDGHDVLRWAGKGFSLAGYNLIYDAWCSCGKPTNEGWHVSADDLIRAYSDNAESYETMRLIIDFDPKSKYRIGLVELLDIYLYTWATESKPPRAAWTPMMLRLRDVFYNDSYGGELTPEDRERAISVIDAPAYDDGDDQRDYVEFLYLNGDDKSWNWGRSGATNAVFIADAARAYFKQFF